MRSVFRQNCFKKCVFRIGGGSLQFDTAWFKIANFKKRNAKRLAFCVFIQKRAFLTWKRGAKLTLNRKGKIFQYSWNTNKCVLLPFTWKVSLSMHLISETTFYLRWDSTHLISENNIYIYIYIYNNNNNVRFGQVPLWKIRVT